MIAPMLTMKGWSIREQCMMELYKSVFLLIDIHSQTSAARASDSTLQDHVSRQSPWEDEHESLHRETQA
jgi:hypothetical protein